MRAVDLLAPVDSPSLRVRLLPVRPELVRVEPAPPWVRRVWPKWAAAITLPKVVWVRPDILSGDPAFLGKIIAHELVHVRQWKTYGAVGFMRHYLSDYVRGRLGRLGHRGAYRAIWFESEAYEIAEKVAPPEGPTRLDDDDVLEA